MVWAATALLPLAKTKRGVSKPSLPQVTKKLLDMPSDQIQRIGSFDGQNHVHLIAIVANHET
jgi:hypothetical protein